MNKVLECERCGSVEDVSLFTVDDVPHTLCRDCRVVMFSPKRSVGRPSVGDTKKVSLTLQEDDWYEFDKRANGNRSKFLRKIVVAALDQKEKTKGDIYFKSELHEQEMKKILKGFNRPDVFKDGFYLVFAYLAGATYKSNVILEAIDEDGIDCEKIEDAMKNLSHGEKMLINLGLDLFTNGNYFDDKISICDVMKPLDDENMKVVKAAINFRFK